MTPPHIEAAARLIVESNMRNTHLRLMSKGRTWVIDKAKWPAMVEENWSDPEVRAEAIESATLVWSLARKATLEEAAKWHDGQAAAVMQIAGIVGLGNLKNAAEERVEIHSVSARAIRALSVEQPTPPHPVRNE